MSSRIAAWGQPPVSIARMRSEGKARFLIKNSWSSRVKISFVTVAGGGISKIFRAWESLLYRCYTLSSISCRVQVLVLSFQNPPVFRRRVSVSEIDILFIVPSNANCEAPFLKVTGRIVRQITFRVFSCSYKLFHRERRVKVKQ
jgi:hypothetical protein